MSPRLAGGPAYGRTSASPSSPRREWTPRPAAARRRERGPDLCDAGGYQGIVPGIYWHSASKVVGYQAAEPMEPMSAMEAP
ncbi:hypothetical protein GCM10027521_27120 [Amycolatopsis cihanbeyliensis]